MKVLITGANGFLGQHLCNTLTSYHDLLATGCGPSRIAAAVVRYQHLDVTDAGAVIRILQDYKPEVIVHTAAVSKPDDCVRNYEHCQQVNLGGMQHLINAASRLPDQPHIIYTSSDFVLGDGGPHSEDAIPAPLNEYGKTKLMAEEMLRGTKLNWAIVRPVFMYGPIWPGMRFTFLHWVNENLLAGKQIRIVNDQWRTPTYVGDACSAIISLIDKSATGIFHIGGTDYVTPYEMAVRFARLRGLDETFIEPVTADSFPEPVHRAKRGGVTIEKAMRKFGFSPLSLTEGLQKTSAAF